MCIISTIGQNPDKSDHLLQISDQSSAKSYLNLAMMYNYLIFVNYNCHDCNISYKTCDFHLNVTWIMCILM